MKLYEFTYTNVRDWADKDVIRGLKLVLEDDAAIQGWAQGWELIKIDRTGINSDGDIVTHWEVHGTYMDDVIGTVDVNLGMAIIGLSFLAMIGILSAIYWLI